MKRPSSQTLALLSTTLLLLLGASACGAPSEAPAEVAPGSEVAAGDEGASGAGTNAEAPSEDEASGSVPEGMISSGQAEAPPDAPPPQRPAQSGVNRLVPFYEAAGAVPFQAYEAGFLPPETAEDVVMLITPRTGESDPGLPAINVIYTVASRNTFRVYQSPAGERPYPEGKESTPVTVGEEEGLLIRQGVTHVLGWERGGTRIEIHSRDIAVDMMRQIAEGMRPYGTEEAEGGDGDGNDAGAEGEEGGEDDEGDASDEG